MRHVVCRLVIENNLVLSPVLYGVAFPRRFASLAHNLSAAALELQSTPAHTSQFRALTGEGASCSSAGEAADTDAIGLQSLAGLYIIVACVAAAAVVSALVFRLTRGPKGSGAEGAHADGAFELDHTATDGEMLRWLVNRFRKLEGKQDDNDNSGGMPSGDLASYGAVDPTKHADKDGETRRGPLLAHSQC